MAASKRNFTFIWKIKNFPFFSKKITSPSFFVNEMAGTKWNLLLYPDSYGYNDCVACYLKRDGNENGPEIIELDYELSFLDRDGFALQSKIFLKTIYRKGECKKFHVKKEGICFLKKDLFIPYDILTIRCRMWNSRESMSQPGRCFAETSLETECRTFVGIIKKFSSTKTNCKNWVCIQSPSIETSISSMNLSITTDDRLFIEAEFVKQELLYMYRYKIFIRDIFGNKALSGHGEFCNDQPHNIPLTLLKEYLIDNRRDYLPNDELTIECEVSFSTGQIRDKIDEPEFGFDIEGNEETKSNALEKNLFSKQNHSESFTTFIDDFSSLFRDSVLCDTNLKTVTETFPAHIAVLCARSPVFKSMFTTEMKEKTKKCVIIDDLDSDTVRQMLLFMYSDTLNDLNYESAKSLYFAADKYNIVTLRLHCSSFLKQNLQQSNYCEILILSHKHQDDDLKYAVQDYIIKNDQSILFSEEWNNLEKNNSQLAAEVLRKYIKIRRI